MVRPAPAVRLEPSPQVAGAPSRAVTRGVCRSTVSTVTIDIDVRRGRAHQGSEAEHT